MRRVVLWAVGAGLGLRPGELVRIEWSDVDWGSRTLLVRGTKTEESADTIPMTPTPAPRRTRKRKESPAPAAEPTPAPEPAKKASPRKRASKAAPTPEVDTEKDKLLLDAFRDAVATAMSETEPG